MCAGNITIFGGILNIMNFTSLKKTEKKDPSSVGHPGFTVLEFLIVVAIMAILIGLILTGLNSARVRAADQGKITNLQTIVVAVEQFRDICRVYPLELKSTETCPELAADNKQLSDIIPEIDSYNFNGSNPNGTASDYVFVPLEDPVNFPGVCIKYHIGVKLNAASDAYAATSSNFNSNNLSGSIGICQQVVGSGFNGADPEYYDIAR